MPYDPFGFSDWGNFHQRSAGSTSGTGDAFSLGEFNRANDLDATLLQAVTPNNYTFGAEYVGDREPGVGIYGGGGMDAGIGVAGVCDHRGVGVYGVAVEDGVGVVGRCMHGEKAGSQPIRDFVVPSGVVGQANTGVGVVGHGGSFRPPPSSNPPDPGPEVRGGVFSAGWRGVETFPLSMESQPVSLSSRPQIQLVASINPTLPAQAQLGDIYFVVPPAAPGAGPPAGQLWICTGIASIAPIWQRIMLGPTALGGDTVPLA